MRDQILISQDKEEVDDDEADNDLKDKEKEEETVDKVELPAQQTQLDRNEE